MSLVAKYARRDDDDGDDTECDNQPSSTSSNTQVATDEVALKPKKRENAQTSEETAPAPKRAKLAEAQHDALALPDWLKETASPLPSQEANKSEKTKTTLVPRQVKYAALILSSGILFIS